MKFDDSSTRNYFDNLISKTRLTLKEMLGQPVNQDEKANVEDYFDSVMKPKYLLNNKNNEVVLMEKMFEETCSVLQDNGIQNPKSLSVLEFYSKIEFLELKFKKRTENG